MDSSRLVGTGMTDNEGGLRTHPTVYFQEKPSCDGLFRDQHTT